MIGLQHIYETTMGTSWKIEFSCTNYKVTLKNVVDLDVYLGVSLEFSIKVMSGILIWK